MNSNLDLDQLFNFTAADALAETETKKASFTSDVYKPSIKDEKCKDGNYRALIRFIPFLHDGKLRTVIERWECFLRDVNGENGVFVVSPKTIGKSCPMRNLSYKLYTSSNAIDKANSKKINVYQQWYALIEVVKDVQHPEYEGRFFVYQFGKKIYDKIIAANKGSEYNDPINPFDINPTSLFEINLTKGAQKMDNGRDVTNYDACGFISKTGPVHYGDGKTLENTPESKREFIDWLENGAPKINNYQWKEWTAELTEKVNTNLATFTSGYTAPRPVTASVKESIDNILATPTTSTPKEETSSISIPTTSEIDVTSGGDDEAWLNDILNG